MDAQLILTELLAIAVATPFAWLAYRACTARRYSAMTAFGVAGIGLGLLVAYATVRAI